MKEEFDLIKLIKEDKTAIVNKQGLKPLFELAEAIRLEIPPLTKDNVEKSLYDIELQIFNFVELSSYFSFIYYSDLKSITLINKMKSSLKTTFLSNAVDDSLRRGILVRFLIENNPDTFSIQSLLKETNMREKAYWIWIDCISHYSLSLVISEVSRHINEENALKNLIIRIPTFLKRFGKNDLRNAIIEWYTNIEDQRSRSSLENWAKNLDIKLGISISAEVHLDKILFFQNPLMQYGQK